jgi:DNA invertase Pin-like site-specific DNA recombinase
MNESISYCIRHDILKDVLIKNRSEVRHMLLTEFDEKKFAKSIWKEGHESGYTEGRESILEILDAINRGNDTVEKLTALGYDAKTAQEVLEKK